MKLNLESTTDVNLVLDSLAEFVQNKIRGNKSLLVQITDLKDSVNRYYLNRMPWLNDEEKKLIVNHNKIQAIKAYRDRCKCSLVDAKNKVESYCGNDEDIEF